MMHQETTKVLHLKCSENLLKMDIVEFQLYLLYQVIRRKHLSEIILRQNLAFIIEFVCFMKNRMKL